MLKRQFRKYENFSQTIRNQSILLYIRNIESKINSQIDSGRGQYLCIQG